MDQLKRLRREKGLSQAKLAALADVDPSTVNQIERGAREASPATLRKLAEALDVGIAELLEETAPKVGRRSSLELTLNGLLEEERLAPWRAVVEDAHQLREAGRARMAELLAAWRASRERQEDPSARRGYLDEMAELLQRAYDARAVVGNAMAGAYIADQWPELIKADRFYIELWQLLQDAGLSIRTEAGEASSEQAQPEARPHEVEERPAA